MRLSRTNAEKIVKELNTVIDQSVNMMNEEGIIIASTDQERVGQIHEGARKIIEQNLEELVIVRKTSMRAVWKESIIRL